MCKGPRILRALLLLGLTGSLVVALALPVFAAPSAADDRHEVEASQLGFGSLSDAVSGTLDLVRQLAGVSGAAQSAAEPPPEPGDPSLDEARKKHETAKGTLRGADGQLGDITLWMDDRGWMAVLSPQMLEEYSKADAAKRKAQAEEQNARAERRAAVEHELARLRDTTGASPDEIAALEGELEELGAEDESEASGANTDPAEPTEQPAPKAGSDQPDTDAAQASLGSPFIDTDEPPTTTEKDQEVPSELPWYDLFPQVNPRTGDEDPAQLVVGGTVDQVQLGGDTDDQATQWFSGSLEDLIKGGIGQVPPEGTGVLPGGCGAKVAVGVPCPGEPTGPPVGLTGQQGGCDPKAVNAFSDCGLINAPTADIFTPAPGLPVPGSQNCGLPGVMAICTLPGGELGGTRTTTTDPKLELAPYWNAGDPFGLDQFQVAPAQPDAALDLAG